MAIIIILITISLTIALVFLAIFYWNMKSGQYDDTYTPSVRILFEDKPTPRNTKKSKPVSEGTATATKQNGER